MNVATILDGHPADDPALITGTQVTTYGDLIEQVAALRRGLAGAGVKRGDRVALVSANDATFVLTYLAVTGIGGIVVPLNPASPPAELERELRAVEPVAVVVGAAASGTAGRIDLTRAGGSVRLVVAADGVDMPGAESWSTVMSASGTDPVPVAECQPDDPAVLIFTAGTAGTPRAAVLTHGNLLSNLEQLQRHPGRKLEAKDVTLGVLPMFHIFGLNVVLGLTLFGGSSVVLLEAFHPSEALTAIRDHGVTILSGAPTVYAALAAVPEGSAADMRTVRMAVSGASRLSPEVAAAFEAKYGIAISEGYGLTEAAPVVTSSVMAAAPKPGSVGVPLSGVEIRLVDEEGGDALEGDAGELWVRGPNVFPGYWHDEAATAAVLTPDGWLRTGDMAVVGADGEIYLVDRAKDIIIVNGFNVFPAEVEDAIAEFPGVAAVAVVGVEDARTGEAVHAFVVAEDGHQLDTDAIREHVLTRLARYKSPTEISLVPSLPYGMGGKLLRRELRRAKP